MPRPKRASVWLHFEYQEGVEFVKNVRNLSVQKVALNLMKHLASTHSIILKDYKNMFNSSGTVPSPSPSLSSSSSSSASFTPAKPVLYYTKLHNTKYTPEKGVKV